jgi:hypothetical protein
MTLSQILLLSFTHPLLTQFLYLCNPKNYPVLNKGALPYSSMAQSYTLLEWASLCYQETDIAFLFFFYCRYLTVGLAGFEAETAAVLCAVNLLSVALSNLKDISMVSYLCTNLSSLSLSLKFLHFCQPLHFLSSSLTIWVFCGNNQAVLYNLKHPNGNNNP